MLEAMIQGLVPIFSPFSLLLMFIMVIYGIIVGILPGIGIIVAMVLMLPFALSLPLKQALIVFGSIGGATAFAGSITAILVNVPGENTSIATLMDGYPMTKKGEAGRAIGACGMASNLSFFISLMLIVALIPLVRIIVKACGTPE